MLAPCLLSKVYLFRQNIIYVVTLDKEDEAMLFLCITKRKRAEGVALKAGMCHSLYDSSLQKGKCSGLDQCMFIYKMSNNPRNRFELLSGNQDLSSQK